MASILTSNQSSNTPSQLLLEIVLRDASLINKIISEISNPDDNSTFIFSSEGIRLIVNGDRTSQVSAFFSATTFNSFTYNSDDCVRYKFSLKDFIEVLDLLREDLPVTDGDLVACKASLKISYRRRGDPLRMRLDNQTNYTIECDLREFSTPSIQPLMAFNEFEDTAEIFFHSKELYKFISGLDLTSSVFLKIVLRMGEIPLKMVTESPTLGEVELEIRPSDPHDISPPIIMRDLDIPTNEHYEFSYRCKFVAPALEALKTSNHCRMKCGGSGLLLMEHFHGVEGGLQSVQYFVLSEAEKEKS